ncbi:MAG TPA: hypothetical protein VF070_35410 [Streptosporangiaceae bacterium]
MTIVLAITSALPAAWPAVQVALTSALQDYQFLRTPLGSVTRAADVVWLTAGAIVMMMAVTRLRPAVRRRVMVAMCPPLVTYVLYGGYAVGRMRLGALAPFGMLPWEALIVVPIPDDAGDYSDRRQGFGMSPLLKSRFSVAVVNPGSG